MKWTRAISVAQFHTNQSKIVGLCTLNSACAFHHLRQKKNHILVERACITHTNQLENAQAANHLCNCCDKGKIDVGPINRGRFFRHKHKQFITGLPTISVACKNAQFRFLSVGLALLCFAPNVR